jgi:hypothetical protein
VPQVRLNIVYGSLRPDRVGALYGFNDMKNGLVMVLRKMQQRTGQEFGYTERCVLFDDFRISRSNVDIL